MRAHVYHIEHASTRRDMLHMLYMLYSTIWSSRTQSCHELNYKTWHELDCCTNKAWQRRSWHVIYVVYVVIYDLYVISHYLLCMSLYMMCMSYRTICDLYVISHYWQLTYSIMPRTRSCHELDHIWNVRISAVMAYMLCNTIFSSRTRSCHELDHIRNARCSAAMLCVLNHRVCELQMVRKKAFIYQCVKIWRSTWWYQDDWVLDLFYDRVRDMSYDRIRGKS